MPYPASECFPKRSDITIAINDIMALCGRRFIIARLMPQLLELLSSTHCAHTTSRAAWGALSTGVSATPKHGTK
jgi:hypothetical protein